MAAIQQPMVRMICVIIVQLYSRTKRARASVTQFFANLLLLLCIQPPRKVLLDTRLYKPMAFNSSLSVSRKGGERTGEDDLASDTSLVHSQLRVRGGVSPGQYHSTVMVI